MKIAGIRRCCGVLLLLAMHVVLARVSWAAPLAYTFQIVRLGSTDSCTILRPWTDAQGAGARKYPVILWVNGYDSPKATYTTGGYLPGLVAWALDGPYLVIADNSSSPQPEDAEACLRWMVQQNTVRGSEFEGHVDVDSIGLAGHSMGAGVVLNDVGLQAEFHVKGTVAMNPWAAGTVTQRWLKAQGSRVPTLLLGGTLDATAPVKEYMATAWNAMARGDSAVVFAVLQGATHNSEAWAPKGTEPGTCDFGRFQQPTTLWWRKVFAGDAAAGRKLLDVLQNVTPVVTTTKCEGYPALGTPNWETQLRSSPAFSLP